MRQKAATVIIINLYPNKIISLVECHLSDLYLFAIKVSINSRHALTGRVALSAIQTALKAFWYKLAMLSLLRNKYGFLAILPCITGLATAGKA